MLRSVVSTSLSSLGNFFFLIICSVEDVIISTPKHCGNTTYRKYKNLNQTRQREGREDDIKDWMTSKVPLQPERSCDPKKTIHLNLIEVELRNRCAVKTHCPRVSRQHQKPALLWARLSPARQSLLILVPPAWPSVSFQPSTLHLTSPRSPPPVPSTSSTPLTSFCESQPLLPHHLFDLNKLFWESSTTKSSSAFHPLVLPIKVLISVLLSIDPTCIAGDFPAAALLPSAHAG